jgi:hypothetical protein
MISLLKVLIFFFFLCLISLTTEFVPFVLVIRSVIALLFKLPYINIFRITINQHLIMWEDRVEGRRVREYSWSFPVVHVDPFK